MLYKIGKRIGFQEKTPLESFELELELEYQRVMIYSKQLNATKKLFISNSMKYRRERRNETTAQEFD